jgi:hypothetical protein
MNQEPETGQRATRSKEQKRQAAEETTRVAQREADSQREKRTAKTAKLREMRLAFEGAGKKVASNSSTAAE